MSWRIAKASVIGTGHTRAGMPCQDSHAVVQFGDTLCVAVSDGLGSAEHSDDGSRLACRVALATLTAGLAAHPSTTGDGAPQSPTPETLLRDAFLSVRTALEQQAAATNLSLRDYACTLLVAMITPAAWYSMHIGDGTIVGLYADTPARTLSVPENGEFINSTTPITSDDYQQHMRYSQGAERLHGVALLSDGVQPMCINYKTGVAYDGFFRPLQTWLAELPDLGSADRVIADFLDAPKMRQKSDDDMTLVLALRA